MNDRHTFFFRLLDAFREAYRSRPSVELDAAWQSDVMRSVRTIGDVHASSVMGFGQFVWRLSPVVLVLILILGTCLMRMDFIPGYELASLYFQNPLNYVWMQSFGIL